MPSSSRQRARLQPGVSSGQEKELPENTAEMPLPFPFPHAGETTQKRAAPTGTALG